MSLLNRLCAELTVSVRKSNVTLKMHFQSGNLVSHEVMEAENRHTGNSLHGVVLESAALAPVAEQSLGQWLQNLVDAHPSLELSFNGQVLTPRRGDA